MTVQTIRPNSSGIDNAGSYVAVGAASLQAAVSDDSDSSYIVGNSAGTVTLAFGGYTLASNERCKGVACRFRMVSPSLGHPVNASVHIGNYAAGRWTAYQTFPVDSKGWFQGTYELKQPDGTEWDQAAISAIETQLSSTTFGGATVACIEQQLLLDIRHQPTVTATGPTGVNPGNTRRPVVAWNFASSDGATQKKFQIKVYDAALNPSPTWSSTVGIVWDSGAVASAASSRAIGVKLKDGNYRVLVEVAVDFNGQDWWSNPSSALSFSLLHALVIPTNLAPVGLTTAGYPTLQGTIAADPSFAEQANQRVQWQIASDSAFTADVQTLVSATWSPPDSPTATQFYTLTSAVDRKLAQQGWYLRARVVDELGDIGPWSATLTFNVSHPLSYYNQKPAPSSIVPRSNALTFSWSLFDADSNAAQTAFRLFLIDSSSTIVYDSGIQTSAAQTWTVDASGFAVDTYNALLLLTDEEGITVAPTVPWQFFLAAAPIVTILTPGSTVLTKLPLVTWSYVPGTGGDSEQSWRVRVIDTLTGVVVEDSGTQLGTDTQYQTLNKLTNNRNYTFEVTATGSTTGYTTVVTTSQTLTLPPPPAPSTQIAVINTIANAAQSAGGFAVPTIDYPFLTWDATGWGDDFQRYEVWRASYGWDGVDLSTFVQLDESTKIAEITDEASSWFADIECARSVDGDVYNAYSVLVVTDAGPTVAPTPLTVAVGVDNESTKVLASNVDPSMAVAYMDTDSSPNQVAVGDAALQKTHRIYGAPLPVVFKAPDARGDEFSMTLIAGFGPDQRADYRRGRIVFDPLLALTRLPRYLSVADGDGRRWNAAVTFKTGEWELWDGNYAVTVDVLEVAPTPVVADVPWYPS